VGRKIDSDVDKKAMVLHIIATIFFSFFGNIINRPLKTPINKGISMSVFLLLTNLGSAFSLLALGGVRNRGPIRRCRLLP